MFFPRTHRLQFYDFATFMILEPLFYGHLNNRSGWVPAFHHFFDLIDPFLRHHLHGFYETFIFRPFCIPGHIKTSHTAIQSSIISIAFPLRFAKLFYSIIFPIHHFYKVVVNFFVNQINHNRVFDRILFL